MIIKSVSDNAIIIGFIAAGTFLGMTVLYDQLHLYNSWIVDVLVWVWFAGLLLIA